MSHELPVVGSPCCFIFANKSARQSRGSVAQRIWKKSSECRGFLSYVQILHLAGKKKKKSLIILKYFFVFNSFLFILYDVSGISLSRKLFLVFFPLENVLGIPSLFARNTLHSSSVALIILLRSFVSSCFIYYKNFVRARTMS